MDLMQQLIEQGNVQYDLAGNYMLLDDKELFATIMQHYGKSIIGCRHKHDNFMYFAEPKMNFTQAIFMLGYFEEIGQFPCMQSENSGLILRVENKLLVKVVDHLTTTPYRFDVQDVFHEWTILGLVTIY